MSLTYAGQPLAVETPALSDILDRARVKEAIEDWDRPGFFGEQLNHIPRPAPRPEGSARLNTLIWPAGASRWATFTGLVGQSQKDAILAAVGLYAATPQNLVISDGTTTKTVAMFLLGFRPIYVQHATQNLWLMQLVDERYFWWFQTQNWATSTIWGTNNGLLYRLYVSLNSSYALTPTPNGTNPIVNAAYDVATFPYGSPSGRWNANLYNKPTPIIIDAAARQVGQRFIRRLSGLSSYVTAATAASEDAARWSANSAALLSGGRLAVGDLIGTIPDRVRTSFWGDSMTVEDVTLASLALSDFGSITGTTGVKGWFAADLYGSAAGATRTALATQAARDYYGWLLSRTDATFRGVRDIDICGLDDRIEWEYLPARRPWAVADELTTDVSARLPIERVVTRIVRSTWSDQNVYGQRRQSQQPYVVQTSANNPGAGLDMKGLILDGASAGGVTVGPQVGFGQDYYALSSPYGAGLARPVVGDVGVAIPGIGYSDGWVFMQGPPKWRDWTPTLTGFTTTVGAPTVTGRYAKFGFQVFFTVNITPAGGGGTVASVAGTSYFNAPGVVNNFSTCQVTEVGPISHGNGNIITGTNRVYMPVWAATTNILTISGWFEAPQ